MDERVPDPAPTVVGVYYVTAFVAPGTDPGRMVARTVTTLDVRLGAAATRKVVVGPEEACAELRRWMSAMCAPP